MRKSGNISIKNSKVPYNPEKFREKLYAWENSGMKYVSTSQKKIDAIKRFLHRHHTEMQIDEVKKLTKLICKFKLGYVSMNFVMG